MPAQVEKFTLQIGGNGRFAGSRQPRQPDDTAGVAVAQTALGAGDFAVAPINIVALVKAVRRTARIVVLGHNPAAGNLESVNYNKSACSDNVRMDVERDRPFGVERQLPATSFCCRQKLPSRVMVSGVDESMTRSMDSIRHSHLLGGRA